MQALVARPQDDDVVAGLEHRTRKAKDGLLGAHMHQDLPCGTWSKRGKWEESVQEEEESVRKGRERKRKDG